MLAFRRKVVYFLEGIWLPIHANLSGLYHLLRGHKTRWFRDSDLEIAHLGWIYCYNCPDCDFIDDNDEHNDLIIWGFYLHRVHRLLQFVCKLKGHKETKESERYTGEKDTEGNYIYKPSGEFYCSKCLADLPSPKEG